MAVVSKTDISRKNTITFQVCLENKSEHTINFEYSEYYTS